MQRVEVPTFDEHHRFDITELHREPPEMRSALICDLKVVGPRGLEWFLTDTRPVGTPTEKAKSEFLRRVSKLTGVLRVERSSERPVAEQSITVFIPEGDIEAEYRVYDLKGELYRRYPEARLDVEVMEDAETLCTSATFHSR